MFKVKSRRINSVEPFEYLPVTADEVYSLGEALTMGTTATKCAAASKPTHICAGPSDGVVVPALPVLATTEFEVPYTEKPTLGTKVQLGATALAVVATTEGAFKVTGIDEKEQTVTGYFE